MVYPHMILYARRITGQGRTIQYFDLVCLPGTPATYGIFSQPEGEGLWKEQFDEAEALSRLQAWTHEERSATKRPRSQITEAGRRWLAQQT